MVCSAGTTCTQGTCVSLCPVGEDYCNGTCVSLSTDPQNCGSCGHVCGAGKSCINGTCVPNCGPGQILCNNACVDPMTSLQHCGACNSGCSPGQTCTAGVCVTACGVGQALCNGACKSLQTDPSSCGACGNACAAGLSCVNGSCGCPAGEVLCNGACVDPASDPTHCGASGSCQGPDAGVTCAAGEVCANGACAASCPAGKSACGGACVDLLISNDHCGGCNTVCPAGSACFDGACEVSGPLYLLDWTAGGYTLDRTTGQKTFVSGLAPWMYPTSATYDRRNGWLYSANGTFNAVKPGPGYWTTIQGISSPRLIAHDPVADVFYVTGAQGFGKWTPTGTLLGAVPSPGQAIAAMAVDSRHRRLYALAGTFLHVYDIVAGTWSLVADTGIYWGSSAANDYRASLAYDPSSERLYVTHWVEIFVPGLMTPTFRWMDPKTGALTTISAGSSLGPIALAIQGDGAQCLPVGGPCGAFSTCHPYEICMYTSVPFQSPSCVSVKLVPDYCPSCANMSCPSGLTCVDANSSEISCN